MQIPARTPAMTAMTAATLDTLSGGRFRLGLGVSGPQVSEGWHGVRFTAPLGRTREYVDIVRMALRRERVSYEGRHFTLPLPDGPGKALKLTVRPPRTDLPVYLAAVGPRNLELAGEIADGWLAIFLSPEHCGELLESVVTGRRRAGRGTEADPLAGFDICPTVPVCISDDVEAAAAAVSGYAALYIGGMGSKDKNFYNQLACRMGFEDAAHRVQELYLAGQHRDAAAAVPFELIDSTSLIGPRERIREQLHRYAEVGVGTLSVAPFAASLGDRLHVVRTMAELMGETGLSSPTTTPAAAPAADKDLL
jgi:F420-dependent oxidoreductase-like protein